MRWLFEDDLLGVPGTEHRVRIERWWFIRRLTFMVGRVAIVHFYTTSNREAERLARQILSGGKA
jgi:hypothetical protein